RLLESVQQTAWSGMDDAVALGESEDEASAGFGGFAGRAADGGVKNGNEQQFSALEFGLPLHGELKGIESAGGANDDGLRAAQKNAQAFLFHEGVKAADDGAVFGAPALGEVHRFDDFRSGTGF